MTTVDSVARVSVADHGPGLPPEAADRIFEPFYTTKGERGTGLGLAQVYGIVQRHGGEVTVSSTLGYGTTFRLVFPAAAPAISVNPRSPAISEMIAKVRAQRSI